MLKRALRSILHNCWFGLIYTVVALIVSIAYTRFFGRLFGILDAFELAFVLLLGGIMVLSGIVGFFRQPNPYSRTYALYDLMDLPPHVDTLDSGGGGWLWQAAPIAIMALILLPRFV
ncbi:MAG TPA: hypothetical protein VHA53_10580 [Nitrolancea sp.]|jgi:hypothetical protein|nr:hypothetical protein [Nitrolancea sp.]